MPMQAPSGLQTRRNDRPAMFVPRGLLEFHDAGVADPYLTGLQRGVAGRFPGVAFVDDDLDADVPRAVGLDEGVDDRAVAHEVDGQLDGRPAGRAVDQLDQPGLDRVLLGARPGRGAEDDSAPDRPAGRGRRISRTDQHAECRERDPIRRNDLFIRPSSRAARRRTQGPAWRSRCRRTGDCGTNQQFSEESLRSQRVP